VVDAKGREGGLGHPLRVMLDTNIFDELAADPVALRRLRSEEVAGRLETQIVYVQPEQLEHMPDPSKRARTLAIARLAREVPTTDRTGVGPGGGRVGFDAFVGPAEQAPLQDVLSGPMGQHAPDGTIAAYAIKHADVLVTNDKQMRKRVERAAATLTVFTWEQFREWLVGPR